MADKEGRFLKRYVKKHAGRTQDIGYEYPRKSSFGQLKKGLIWNQRSVATALADAGILITNLNRAGRWKSDAVAK
eukprot:4226973-Ditylum_brightwellii.AAC.1